MTEPTNKHAALHKELRERQVRHAITEGYLETGDCLDVPAIAARLHWSESKVRRVIDEAHGAPKGIHAHQDFRESHSKSYPSVAVGGHRVWVYAPATWFLRDMVNALRKELAIDPMNTSDVRESFRNEDGPES